ncbi:MAG TPA: MotA/TolQ/ExbB proton channel family protein, partial [Pseudomonadota bacterium]|nr:MotA/TolQ/ExbB proton channel family protein [Pseudomonadota bacterium]
FLAILNSGIGDANQMAGGIGEALVCTAAGLCVAIPAYIFHRHLRAKVAGLGIELEKEVVALIDVIEAEVPVQVAAARRAAK